MWKILISMLWDMVFGETGIVKSVFDYFNRVNLAMALDVESIFRDFGIEFTTVRNIIYSFAFYLILLKFVKKILDVYALQTDGDANADIFVVITNFCKAMVIAMSFTVIWGWIFDIAYDFGRKLVDSIQWINGEWLTSNTGNKFLDCFVTMYEVGEKAGSGTAFFVIAPVFAGLCFILMLLQMKNGMELWILRLGVPLACCGLMDADQGVFKQYMKLLWKEVLTILIQLFLLNAGMFLMMNAMKLSPGTAVDILSGEAAEVTVKLVILGILACATIITAFATPKILSEFLVPKQGGGGRVMQAVYMGSSLLRGVL